MSVAGHITRLILRASWVFISRLIFIIGGGILLNWGYFAYATFLLYQQTFTEEVSLKSLTALLPFLLIIVFFIVAFPLLYYYVAKPYAVIKAIAYIYQQNKVYLFEYLVHKRLEYLDQLSKKKPGATARIEAFSAKTVKHMQNIPRPIRVFFSFLLNQIPFVPVLTEIKKEVDFKRENIHIISQKLSEKLDHHIQDEILNAGDWLVWGLFAGNIITMLLVYYFVL